MQTCRARRSPCVCIESVLGSEGSRTCLLCMSLTHEYIYECMSKIEECNSMGKVGNEAVELANLATCVRHVCVGALRR